MNAFQIFNMTDYVTKCMKGRSKIMGAKQRVDLEQRSQGCTNDSIALFYHRIFKGFS